MTLDDMLTPQPGPATPGMAARKCPHPRAARRSRDWDDKTTCLRCGHVFDPARSRAGKSSRRLGNDQERRAERTYGWEKIGERGQITDLRGSMFKVQQKATRSAPPAQFVNNFRELAAVNDGRIPLLLLSYVRVGVAADDYIVIRGSDWLALHGRDE